LIGKVEMINHKNQYVYAYLDPRKPGKWTTSNMSFLYEPIYIGEGKNKRAWSHLKRKDRHPLVYKISSMKRVGLEPYIMLIAEGLSGDEGLAIETKLINEIGTKAIINTVQRGPLTNLQIEEGKKKIMSEETKAKLSIAISKALMGHPVSDETKRKISEAYHVSPKSRENRAVAHRIAHLGKKMSEQSKAAIGAYFRGIPKSEEQRKKMSVASLGKPKSASHRDALSSARSKSWKITFDKKSMITYKLKDWCDIHHIKIESLKSAYRRGLPFNGYFLEKL
jgi:hypothetical protein